MANPMFQIYIGKDGQCHFRFITSDDEIVLISEGYASVEDCVEIINGIKANCGDSRMYKKTIEANEKYGFVLLTNKGEMIGKSRAYETGHDRDNGISSVMHKAPDASVEDRS